MSKVVRINTIYEEMDAFIEECAYEVMADLTPDNTLGDGITRMCEITFERILGKKVMDMTLADVDKLSEDEVKEIGKLFDKFGQTFVPAN